MLSVVYWLWTFARVPWPDRSNRPEIGLSDLNRVMIGLFLASLLLGLAMSAMAVVIAFIMRHIF